MLTQQETLQFRELEEMDHNLGWRLVQQELQVLRASLMAELLNPETEVSKVHFLRGRLLQLDRTLGIPEELIRRLKNKSDAEDRKNGKDVR